MKLNSVLVVDDSLFMRKILENTLNDLGFTKIIQAQNANDAILKYKDAKPDLVTLDLVMPGMNGFDCLKEILKIDKNAIVIMLSTLSNEDLVTKALKYGAKGYVIKPFTKESIQNALAKIMVT